jgi:hypothetical protein
MDALSRLTHRKQEAGRGQAIYGLPVTQKMEKSPTMLAHAAPLGACKNFWVTGRLWTRSQGRSFQGCCKIGKTREEDGNAKRDVYQGEQFRSDLA